MFIENIPGENMNVDQKLVDFAVSIAKEAGDLTLSFFNDLNLEIIKKDPTLNSSIEKYLFTDDFKLVFRNKIFGNWLIFFGKNQFKLAKVKKLK